MGRRGARKAVRARVNDIRRSRDPPARHRFLVRALERVQIDARALHAVDRVRRQVEANARVLPKPVGVKRQRQHSIRAILHEPEIVALHIGEVRGRSAPSGDCRSRSSPCGRAVPRRAATPASSTYRTWKVRSGSRSRAPYRCDRRDRPRGRSGRLFLPPRSYWSDRRRAQGGHLDCPRAGSHRSGRHKRSLTCFADQPQMLE